MAPLESHLSQNNHSQIDRVLDRGAHPSIYLLRMATCRALSGKMCCADIYQGLDTQALESGYITIMPIVLYHITCDFNGPR